MTAEGSTDRTTVARRRGIGSRGDRNVRRLPSVLGLQLRHRLGHGGEGEVWAAAAPDGVIRALKLIRPEMVADPETFADRADALTRITDPALVRVLEAQTLTDGEWAGWGAMVMDLIEGEPLDDARLGPSAFADLAPLGRALDRLHRGEWSGGDPLVHRDVKPGNLIRTPDGEVVLVDPSSLRNVGGDMTFVGTPVFVAPEVPSGRFGPPADIYSFAATLVALHSGARGDELAALLAEPEALDVPEPVVRALSLAPADRPDRCLDLVDDTQTVVVRPDRLGGDDAAHPQTTRTWWRLGLLTAATLPVVAGLVLSIPMLAIGGLVGIAGLLAIDPALRDSSLLWLPMACARWLVRTLETDDDERERVTAAVHGALLVSFLPLAGVLAGLGPQMIVLGTTGQITGVAVICAVALMWFAVAAADNGDRGLSVSRVVLAPIWTIGVFAEALARVVLAINDALRAGEAERAAARARAASERASDDDQA